MDPERVLELCRQHAAAEGEGDVEATLATLNDHPVFEFYPMTLKIEGRDKIERFYREQYNVFAKRVAGYEVLSEWTNSYAALQEYVIDVAEDDGSTTKYFVMSMMPGDDATGLLTGERLYCDDGFVRALLGPLYPLCEKF